MERRANRADTGGHLIRADLTSAIIRMRQTRTGRYGAQMAMTHALMTTAQAPIARGPLQAIRLRIRRLALECAG